MNYARLVTSPATPPPPLPEEHPRWELLVAAGASVLVWAQVVAQQVQERPLLLAIDVAFGLGAYWLVFKRPTRPLLALLAASLLAAFSGIASGPQALAFLRVASGRKPQEIVISLVSFLVSAITFWLVEPFGPGHPWWLMATTNVVLAAALVGWGALVGQHRELVEVLIQRVAKAELKQAANVEDVKVSERQVIAREMHDVLAHRITQLSMQAGAMAYRTDLGADQLRSGITQIQTQANEALADLRSVLGVLRDPGTGEPINRPQPTFRDLNLLFEEATTTGVPIELTTTLSDIETMSPNTGRTLYRIFQEAITNARKHDPTAELHVEIFGSPSEGVSFIVRNPITTSKPFSPSSGLGIVGLTERAQILGGRLSAATRGNVFELRGWLPWQT